MRAQVVTHSAAFSMRSRVSKGVVRSRIESIPASTMRRGFRSVFDLSPILTSDGATGLLLDSLPERSTSASSCPVPTLEASSGHDPGSLTGAAQKSIGLQRRCRAD